MMKSELVIEERKMQDNQSFESGKRRRIQKAARLLINLTLIGDVVEGVAGLVNRVSVRTTGGVDGLALVSRIDGLVKIRFIILFYLKVTHRFRTLLLSTVCQLKRDDRKKNRGEIVCIYSNETKFLCGLMAIDSLIAGRAQLRRWRLLPQEGFQGR